MLAKGISVQASLRIEVITRWTRPSGYCIIDYNFFYTGPANGSQCARTQQRLYPMIDWFQCFVPVYDGPNAVTAVAKVAATTGVATAAATVVMMMYDTIADGQGQNKVRILNNQDRVQRFVLLHIPPLEKRCCRKLLFD